MEFSKVYTVKKEVSEQQFLRKVLIELSKDQKSPSNVMDAKFGQVTEFTSEFLLLEADVEVNYSGSCGYDRQEQYQTTESKHLSEGDEYTIGGIRRRASRSGSYEVDVVKMRTVTDWRPHSGTLKKHTSSVELNEGNEDAKRLLTPFVKAMEEAKDESVVEEGTASVNAAAYQSAGETCERKAKYAVSWPGDRTRDEQYNCSTDVTGVECYIVPCYKVEFVYNGKKYCAIGVAFGKANEVHKVPKADGNVESVEIIEQRRASKVEVAEKPLKIKKICTVLAVITGVIGLSGLLNSGESWATGCLLVGFIAMAICIAAAIVLNKKVQQEVGAINAQADAEKKALNDIKVNNLVVALKKYNLPALNTTEKNEISNAR